MQTIPLDPWTSFTPSSAQISTEVENDIVILNTETGKYYSLEGVASFIWQALKQGETLADIEQSISQTYQISASQSQEDTHAFISALHSAGLIEIHA